MYTQLAKAGRHGAYTTMFTRATSQPYMTRDAAQLAHSRKAIDRRLVLPLDAHHWPRALEVLSARYARLARRASDYQRVIRDMVEHTTGAAAATTAATAGVDGGRVVQHDSQDAVTQRARGGGVRDDVIATLDALRDAAFAGDIPTSVSLWVTFVWAYCALQRPREALEAMTYAQRRVRLSRATRQHMAVLVLPLLAQAGCYAEAQQLADTELLLRVRDGKDGDSGDGDGDGDATTASATTCCDVRQVRVCLAEAAARGGQWQRAVQHLRALSLAPRVCNTTQHADEYTATTNTTTTTASNASTPPMPQLPTLLLPSSAATLRSLFVDTPRHSDVTNSTTRATAAAAPSRSWTSDMCVSPSSSPSSSSDWATVARDVLSTTAQRQLLHGAALAGQCEVAEVCWRLLYAPASTATATTTMTAVMESEDVHVYLDCLCRAGRWRDAVGVFAALYLGCSDGATRYTSPSTTVTVTRCGEGGDVDTTRTQQQQQQQQLQTRVPLDDTVVNMVFSAFPCTKATDDDGDGNNTDTDTEASDEGVVRVVCARGVVRLLDDLLRLREDMRITDYVLATVAPALLQLGDEARALQLLQHARLLAHTDNKDSVTGKREVCARALVRPSSPAQRALQVRLARVVYALYTRAVTALSSSSCQGVDGNSTDEDATAASNDDDVRRVRDAAAVVRAFPHLFAHEPRAQRQQQATSSSATGVQQQQQQLQLQLQQQQRQRRRPWAAARPTAVLTEMQEQRMRSQFARLYAQRDALCARMSTTAADADPRPPPRGLHDNANGWAFAGRNGEMVFANSRRTAHLLQMWPKQMRSLGNPYRGWSVWQNSCLAHVENVKKWNGRSSV